MNFVGQMAKWSSQEPFSNDRVHPFFAVLMCEVLQQAEEV